MKTILLSRLKLAYFLNLFGMAFILKSNLPSSYVVKILLIIFQIVKHCSNFEV